MTHPYESASKVRAALRLDILLEHERLSKLLY